MKVGHQKVSMRVIKRFHSCRPPPLRPDGRAVTRRKPERISGRCWFFPAWPRNLAGASAPPASLFCARCRLSALQQSVRRSASHGAREPRSLPATFPSRPLLGDEQLPQKGPRNGAEPDLPSIESMGLYDNRRGAGTKEGPAGCRDGAFVARVALRHSHYERT